jgi:fructokinase
MTDASFLVIGEALVDLIGEAGSWQFEATPGGSPLNVAVGLAAAGHRVRLASELGGDLFGVLVRGHLTSHRVDSTDLVRTAAPTNLAFARLDGAGGAGYDFRLGWTWRGQPDLASIDCLHVGSLGAVLPPGADAVREAVADARRLGIPVSYDPNVRPALMGRSAKPTIEALVAAADLVKVSSDDLAWLYPGTPVRDAAAAWADQQPRVVVVTLGAAGAFAVSTEYQVDCPAPQVRVVDTVGAGDAFQAGLLSSLARAGALADPTRTAVQAALRDATALAALVCSRRGYRLPEQIG